MISQIADLIALWSLPGFLVLGAIFRHKKFDAPRFWKLRALAVTAFTYYLSMAIGMGWGALTDGVSLLPGAALGTIGGAIAGVLTYELGHYWYHRLAHRSDFLWRHAHQMHHSAESLDAFGAYYLHPLDTLAFTTISSLVLFPLLGLSPAAGGLAAAFLAFNAMFQHANMKTPRWLGLFIQRPESHSVHHARHRHNYADLPLWDLVFGTYVNPIEMEPRVGLYKGASARLVDMLLGRDVSEPEVVAAPAALPAAAPARGLDPGVADPAFERDPTFEIESALDLEDHLLPVQPTRRFRPAGSAGAV